MWNAIPIQLRNQQVYLKELTIGEIMQIAKIPQEMNELRINSFIGFVCEDNFLAQKLTVQERYCILLNYLALSNNDYMLDTDTSEYFIQNNLTENREYPEFIQLEGVYVHCLYGNQVSLLQQKCENVYDWLCGCLALQLSGDLTAIFNSETPVIWDKADTTNEQQLDNILQQRFKQIENLTDSQFQRFTEIYYQGCDKLRHLVDISLDNDGITLIKQGGDGDNHFARFHPLALVSDIAKQLAECITKQNDS